MVAVFWIQLFGSGLSGLGNNNLLFQAIQNEKRQEGIYYSKHVFSLTTAKGVVIKELDYFVDEYATFIQKDGAGMVRPLTQIKNKIFFKKYLYILSWNGRDIFIYTSKGDLLKILQLEINGIKITNSDKENIISVEKRPLIIRLIRTIGFPDRKPAVYDIIVDDRIEYGWKKDIHSDSLNQKWKNMPTWLLVKKENIFLTNYYP